MLITANGTTVIDVDGGRDYVFSAAGTFGGGTLTVKWSDGTNDVTVVGPSGDIILTAGASYVIAAPATYIKLVLTGATNPNITASLVDRLR